MKGQRQDSGSPDVQAVQPARAGWSDLARAAGYEGDEIPEPETLAQLINLNSQAPEIGRHLYALIQQTILEPGADPATTAQLHSAAGRFLAGVNVDVLADALRSQSNTIERKRLLHAAVDVLNPAALRTLALAVSSAASPALNVLLSKLELQAGRAASSKEVESYRRLVHALVETGANGAHGTEPFESRGQAGEPE